MKSTTYVWCDRCRERVPENMAREEITRSKCGPHFHEIICANCDEKARVEALRSIGLTNLRGTNP